MSAQHAQPAVCRPSLPCPQQLTCARANAWPKAADGRLLDPDEVTQVDASICLRAGWCPMFIDRRGMRLLEAA